MSTVRPADSNVGVIGHHVWQHDRCDLGYAHRNVDLADTRWRQDHFGGTRRETEGAELRAELVVVICKRVDLRPHGQDEREIARVVDGIAAIECIALIIEIVEFVG